MTRYFLHGLATFCLLVGVGLTRQASAASHAQLGKAVLNLATLQPGQQAVAAVVLDIAPGYHAQSHTPSDESYIKFVAKLDPVDSLNLFDPVYPAGVDETYGLLGKLNVYTGRVIIYVPLQVKPDAKPGPLKLSGKLRYQVCDDRVCYPPSTTPFSIDSQIVAQGQPVQPQDADLFAGFDSKVFSKLGPAASQPAATQPGASSGGGRYLRIFGLNLTDHSYPLAFAAAFFVGILFNAVPCVLPVLPLKAIGFYEVSQHNRAQSLAFGAVFSAGVVASFGVLALLVVVFRVFAWGELYSYTPFLLALVAILVAMAISTFGFFTVNLPPAIYSITPRHDTYTGNFLFGILTAILSTPCTFGLFLGLLVWATKQPAAVGTTLVMTVGAGMASPYFVLSAFPEAARRFPRTGPWAELVKQMMGFLLLGTAIFFARRFFVPLTGADGFWWVLFALVLVAAGFMMVRSVRLTNALQPRLVVAAIAVVLIVPSFLAARTLAAQPYVWTPYSAEALTSARSAGRVVVVEFTASWCSNCQVLESFVLHDQRIVRAVKHDDVQMLKADLTSEDAPGWPLLKQLNPIAAIPFTAVYRPGAAEPTRLTGIYSVGDLETAIRKETAAGQPMQSSLERATAKSILIDHEHARGGAAGIAG